MVNLFKKYYVLTKPGIIRGNLITAAAGFFLASKGEVNLLLFAGLLIGTALIIASGCVFNNYIDRDIDKLMSRTRKRALANGDLSNVHALIFASLLSIIGFICLITLTNRLTVAVGAVGLFAYVVVYSIGKRNSIHGTVLGSISGATPPVAGYVAVTGSFDVAALLLFLILVFWQMPHFYAIAMFRAKDYKAAGIPVLPVMRGMKTTKVYIILYIFAYLAAVIALTIFGYTGVIYLIVTVIASSLWLWSGLKGMNTTDDVAWARKMFGVSLVVLMAFSIMISLESLLP